MSSVGFVPLNGFFFLFLTILVSCRELQGWAAEDENKLIKDILTKYDKRVRPVKNSSDAVNVTVDITFHNIIDVDEKRQILTMSLWLRQTWSNQLVAWNPEAYGGVTSVMVQATDIWQPDTVLYQNIIKEFDGRLDHTNTRIRISHDGSNFWATPFVMVTLCKIAVSDFPFDSQKCKLTFGSWQYDGRQVNLLNDKEYADIAKARVENGEWDVKKVLVERRVSYYQCCPNASYPDVSFIIHMTRKSLFYFVNLVVPNILITLLAFFSFFIPVECGERISFVMTVLLSMTVFLLLVAESIPPTSEAVPVIGIFYTASIVEVFLALIGTGISLKINYSYLFGDGVSLRLRSLLFKTIGPFLGFKVKKILGDDYLQKLNDEREMLRQRSRESAPILNRMRSSTKFLNTEELVDEDQLEVNGQGLRKKFRTINNRTPILPQRKAVEAQDAVEGVNRESFLKDIRLIADTVKEQAEGERKILESKLAAAIADRFFLWLFVVIFILSIVIILVYLPGRET